MARYDGITFKGDNIEFTDERAVANSADEFSTLVDYAVGKFCTYDGYFYQFIVDHPAGAWNVAHVQRVNVGDLFTDLKEDGESIPGTDVSPYIIRKTDSAAVDHPYKREKLIGGTVAWNQRATKLIDAQSSRNGITITDNSDGSITINGTFETTSNALTCNRIANIPRIIDHIYYIPGIKGSAPQKFYAFMYGTDDFRVYENGLIKKYQSYDANTAIAIFGTAEISIDNVKYYPQGFDLTQMFGSAVADYIYSLEQATAGAGVAFFRSLFPADYYPYNAGQLMSVKASAHKTTGKNLVEDELLSANISGLGVIALYGVLRQYKMNLAQVTKGVTYTVKSDDNFVAGFFTDKPVIGSVTYDGSRLDISNKTFTAPITGWVAFRSSYSYSTPQCEIGSVSTDYEPYAGETYTLDPNLELRGIPQLVNNKLVYDGDTYEANGKVKRRYGIVDLGSLEWNKLTTTLTFFSPINFVIKPTSDNTKTPNVRCSNYPSVAWYNVVYGSIDKAVTLDNTYSNTLRIVDSTYSDAATFKTAMSGVYLVYELDTETEEQALPFYSTMKCDSAGIEEWIDERTVAIPVGHETLYLGASVGEGAYSGAGWKQGDEVIRRNTAELLGYREDTDVATHNITAGQYVVWKDGLYKAKSNISTGTALSSTNLDAVPTGGLNDLQKITEIDITNFFTPTEGIELVTTSSTKAYKHNQLITAYIMIKKTDNTAFDLSTNNRITLGLIASAYTPADNFCVIASGCQTAGAYANTFVGNCIISTSGSVYYDKTGTPSEYVKQINLYLTYLTKK